MNKKHFIKYAGISILVAAITGVAVWKIPDRTRIEQVSIEQIPVPSNLERIYSEAQNDSYRYTMGGCEKFPSDTSNNYLSFQISAKTQTNRSIGSMKLLVSDFGAYANHWLFADHALGSNSVLIAVLYTADLTESQITEAVSDLTLALSYETGNQAKDIPVVISDDAMDRQRTQ